MGFDNGQSSWGWGLSLVLEMRIEKDAAGDAGSTLTKAQCYQELNPIRVMSYEVIVRWTPAEGAIDLLRLCGG